MRISDWSSDVCSSDLQGAAGSPPIRAAWKRASAPPPSAWRCGPPAAAPRAIAAGAEPAPPSSRPRAPRSEEHTSELQSLMRISYAVFCLKKTINNYRLLSQTNQRLDSLTYYTKAYTSQVQTN